MPQFLSNLRSVTCCVLINSKHKTTLLHTWVTPLLHHLYQNYCYHHFHHHPHPSSSLSSDKSRMGWFEVVLMWLLWLGNVRCLLVLTRSTHSTHHLSYQHHSAASAWSSSSSLTAVMWWIEKFPLRKIAIVVWPWLMLNAIEISALPSSQQLSYLNLHLYLYLLLNIFVFAFAPVFGANHVCICICCLSYLYAAHSIASPQKLSYGCNL